MSTNDTGPLEAAASDAAAAVERLTEELGITRRLSKLLNQLIDYRDKNLPVHIRAYCDKEKALLANLRSQKHPAIATVEEIYRDAKEKAEIAVRNLPRELLNLAKGAVVPLDESKSRHPKYYFLREGFVEVLIDDKKQTASVCNRENRGVTISADAKAVIEAVCSEQRRLFERDFTGADFLDLIYKAYLQVLKKGKGREGDPVQLRAIFRQCADEQKDSKTPKYQPDEFLIDMSMLAEHGPRVIKGLTFSLQQTKDTEEGLLLIGPAGQGMVGLIYFHPKETQNHD